MAIRETKPKPSKPLTVAGAISKLGNDIRGARLRRRTPATILAQSALISRTTLYRVERGDASVSIGTYATVLSRLGMLRDLAAVADISHDALKTIVENELDEP